MPLITFDILYPSHPFLFNITMISLSSKSTQKAGFLAFFWLPEVLADSPWNWDKKFLLKSGKSLNFLCFCLSAGKMRLMSVSLLPYMDTVRVNLISHIKWFCVLYSWDRLTVFYSGNNQRPFYFSIYYRGNLDLKIGYSTLEYRILGRLEGCFPLEILESVGFFPLDLLYLWYREAWGPFQWSPIKILPPFLPGPVNIAI